MVDVYEKDGMRIAVYQKPLVGIGGDFYRFLKNGNTIFILGDYSGKSLPPNFEKIYGKLKRLLFMDKSVAQTLTDVNNYLCDRRKRTEKMIMREARKHGKKGVDLDMGFVAASVASWSKDNNTLTYSISAQEGLLYRAETNEMLILPKEHVCPLGIYDGVKYYEETCEMTPGDKLIFYTDGYEMRRHFTRDCPALVEHFGLEDVYRSENYLSDFAYMLFWLLREGTAEEIVRDFKAATESMNIVYREELKPVERLYREGKIKDIFGCNGKIDTLEELSAFRDDISVAVLEKM